MRFEERSNVVRDAAPLDLFDPLANDAWPGRGGGHGVRPPRLAECIREQFEVWLRPIGRREIPEEVVDVAPLHVGASQNGVELAGQERAAVTVMEPHTTRALSVTFLIPAFGLLWGGLFLGEALPAGALAGAVLIVLGTVLVTRG